MKSLKVFFNPAQSVVGNASFSPSAGKPEKLLAVLKLSGLNIAVVDFPPATIEDLSLAHDPSFVKGVLAGTRANGFGNTNLDVAASLPWTTGSIVAASLFAYHNGENTCSLSSGFHHASYARAGAFCTFNGLVVAAFKLRQAGAKRIGIVDCDQHYGDGTASLIEHHNMNDVIHYTFGGEHVTADSADRWLKGLPQTLAPFDDCDVIIYQAGADPYVNDPLGGALTKDQLRRRDERVFEHFYKVGIPVAWNLAGGYTNPFSEVLEIHTNTAIACLAATNARPTPGR